ncbi:unnamed protein product [Rotaria magnacalcarata]|uniref:Uncharacterized protein n=5 Tax=Rotaria magnacalcarata TaxID=392030 RepID=A0A818XPG2_9BILA|nr:unnamed protein product [Rotaria magnacalcarata]
MSEEEIGKINRKLQKMIDKSEVDESMARDFLIRLQESRITLSILQKTGIGKTVNNLRRVIANDDLSTVAKSLLKNWKKLVPESSSVPINKDDKQTIPTNNNNNSQHSQETNGNTGKNFESSKSIERQISQTSTSSYTSASQTHDEIRLKSRDLIASAFSISELPEGSADPVDLAGRVEDAIFKDIKDTGVKYRNRIRSRISNLKDLKNPNLRINVLIGFITPERLATLTAEEMASDALKQERSKLNESAINEHQLAMDEGTGTDLIQCGKCKQNNCAYTEAQTRSADEPMTLFVFYFIAIYILIKKMSGGTNSKSASQLMIDANKKAKSANGFFQRMLGAGNTASEDARALYVQAGNAGKAESNYPISVEAYKRALDLSVEDFEKAQMYEAIASSYKMFDLPQAVPALTSAAELHMSQGKWTMASQTLEKVAELYEQLNDLDNMMKCLKEAHRFLKQEGQKAAANRVQKKMAETLALQHEFMKAQQQYEEMGDKTKDDAMLKYGAKDFWLRATMCALCIDVENANTALARYVNDNPLFEERSLEVKLLRQLIAAVEEQSKESFLKHIDSTPLSTLRSDRVFRSLTEDIAKKITGDPDLK